MAPIANRKSPRRKPDVKSDPYDITQDAEILEESVRESLSRRASQQKKKALLKARESLVVRTEACKKDDNDAEVGDEPLAVNEDGDYLCATCPRSFKSLAGRQRHVAKCATSVPPEGVCPCCSVDFASAHAEGDLRCEECDGLFPNNATMTRHVEIVHRGSELFCCAVCPSVFYERKAIVAHLATHSDVKPWMCKNCNAVFTRKYHLDRHFRQSGCDGLPHESNVCQVCGREFTRKDNLREHLRAHAGINKRLTVYTCEFCNEVIAGLRNYNTHKRIKHVGDRPYKCSYCPMTFPTSAAMKKHQRRHTGEKPYECHLCFKKFAAKETLNRHMKIHTQEKPHVCTQCGKAFIQNAQLKSHMIHHTGEPMFKCDRCEEAFPRKISLLNHVLYIHEKASPMFCDHCDKQFYIKGELERHMSIHTKGNGFQCDICRKTFAQKGYLKVHALTHTREPPRACNYCNRAFIRQDCLLRHMRSKHRDKIEKILMEAERKKLQLQLMSFTKEPALPETAPSNELADALPASISELLNILVDEDTLKGFGSPHAPVEDVLKMVIKRCGHAPVEAEDMDYLDCLRENAKLLFTVVIDDAGVKDLLNNQSVDVVIQHVLNLVKS